MVTEAATVTPERWVRLPRLVRWLLYRVLLRFLPPRVQDDICHAVERTDPRWQAYLSNLICERLAEAEREFP